VGVAHDIQTRGVPDMSSARCHYGDCAMKVSELISILKEMPQDLPVFYATDIHDGWYLLAPQGIRKESVECYSETNPHDIDICLIGEYP
jgi:hypothetical protein